MLAGRNKIISILSVILLLSMLLLLAVKCVGVIKISLIALIISFLLAPAVSHLQRKMNRSLAILIVYLSTLAIVFGIILLVLLPMLAELSHLPEYAFRLGGSLQTLFERLSERIGERELPMDVFTSVQNAMTSGAGKLLTAFFSLVSGAAGFFADALAALALSWFFLIDWEKLTLRLFLCVPSGVRAKTITALSSVRRDLGQYLKAQSLLIAFMGALTVAVLYVTRVPMPVSLGMMYALLNAIPYVGPLIGTIPPVLAALTASPINALYTLIALLLIQQADNYILSPRIMGAASGSGASTVLIAISLGGALYGVTGMFLALPTLVTVKSVYRVFTAPKT